MCQYLTRKGKQIKNRCQYEDLPLSKILKHHTMNILAKDRASHKNYDLNAIQIQYSKLLNVSILLRKINVQHWVYLFS